MSASAPADPFEGGDFITLEPQTGIVPRIDWSELWHYRDLLRFMVWRGVKARYAQSVLGIGWALLQPLFSMSVFTIIFGRLAKIGSDGAPYAVFSLAGLVPWVYFSGALSDATTSLVGSSNLLNKVYFPRMVIPLAGVVSKLVDFGISFTLLVVVLLSFGIVPGPSVLALPFLVLLMAVAAAGIGMGLGALAIHYRDVSYALSFIVQGLMYISPVVYPVSLVPGRWRLVYGLNPMAGVIEGFRAALLGTRPMPWDLLAVGTASALLLALLGTMYFRRLERTFADIA
jgi:lipopolysaccharide transport system permease protein